MSIGLKFKAFLSVLTIFLSCSVAGFVYAQDLPNSCDEDFFKVMQAHARMEGQREVETAAKLILRPDSVLEYSCFDVRVRELGTAANIMFSDNVLDPFLFKPEPSVYPTPQNEFQPTFSSSELTSPVEGAENNTSLGQTKIQRGPHPPPNETRLTSAGLDNALSSLIETSLTAYIGSNFGHRFASDLLVLPPGQLLPCSGMDVVWKFLKCQDVNQNNFFRFEQLALSDPRNLPIFGACNDSGRSAMWEADLAASVIRPTGPVLVETMEPHLHLDLFEVNTCAPPIPTGVKVFPLGDETTREPFDDALCITPGCYFDGQSSCLAN